jgi:hypothetical protein
MRRDDPLLEEIKFACCALHRGDPPHSPNRLRNLVAAESCRGSVKVLFAAVVHACPESAVDSASSGTADSSAHHPEATCQPAAAVGHSATADSSVNQQPR